MEDSRKQFEEAFEQLKHDRFGSNEEWAWKFWQASRAAIEINFPSTSDIQCQECADEAMNRACHAVVTVGLKIKE
jgi:hypothetical protein